MAGKVIVTNGNQKLGGIRNGDKKENNEGRREKSGRVWTVLVSLRRDVSEANDLGVSASKIADNLFDSIMSCNKRHGFDKAIFSYAAAVHKDTDNQHMHFRLFQPEGVAKSTLVRRIKLAPRTFAMAKKRIEDQLVVPENAAAFKARAELRKVAAATLDRRLRAKADEDRVVESLSEVAALIRKRPRAMYMSLRSSSDKADWVVARKVAQVAVGIVGTGLGAKDFEAVCDGVIRASLGSRIRGVKKSISVSGKTLYRYMTKRHGILAGGIPFTSGMKDADAEFIRKELERATKISKG